MRNESISRNFWGNIFHFLKVEFSNLESKTFMEKYSKFFSWNWLIWFHEFFGLNFFLIFWPAIWCRVELASRNIVYVSLLRWQEFWVPSLLVGSNFVIKNSDIFFWYHGDSTFLTGYLDSQHSAGLQKSNIFDLRGFRLSVRSNAIWSIINVEQRNMPVKDI